jgi:hypothetical protein
LCGGEKSIAKAGCDGDGGSACLIGRIFFLN